ncbi:MAG TPA: hypothetical protein VHF58_00345 [Solirubrobacterales bacterium]|nr:hypothetical protein [Solirubrobacterales bacterium]
MKAGLKMTLAAGLTALAIGGATTATASASAAGEPQAKRADCSPDSVSEATRTYATYVYTVKTRNTSCGKAWKVIKAFHACRKENGGARGKCNSRVEGYKCDEGKRDTVVKGVRYRSNVVCKKGAKKVKHEYEMAY